MTRDYVSSMSNKEIHMAAIYRLLLGLVFLGIGLTSGCGGGGGDGQDESTAVVFSDIHFNPFYDPTLFPDLLAADASEWARIFETSSITTPSTWGTDTNYPLLAISLSSIRARMGDSSVVVYNGDLLGHYFPQTFFKLFGSEDVAAMKAFADKTVAFVMDQIRLNIGEVPIMFAVGNSDSYTGYGPDSSFLSNTAELYFTNFINGAANHEEFLETFKSGGYYAAEPTGASLMVVGLNTNLLSSAIPGNHQSAVDAELAWLDSKLAAAKANGKKVWLVMHVPAGGDLVSTGKLVDGSGQLESTVMMWRQDYQARFLSILSSYSGTVTLTFAGHTHMDEYRIASGNVFHISPGISPVFGNNPAFKIFTYSNSSLEAIDYKSLNYDLASMPSHFNDYYKFSSAYSMQGSLDSASEQLVADLPIDQVKQDLYRTYYYSGLVPANSITGTNWPVYWCGIDNMEQQSLISCVNSY